MIAPSPTAAAPGHVGVKKLRRIVFNGKFYSGALNGVHRVADRLIGEVDRLLTAMPDADRPQAEIHVPLDRAWSPKVETIKLIEHPGAASQRWEQLRLPRLAKDGVLINLCNLAPIAHRRKIMLIHDAQFLFRDASYPWRQLWGHRLLVPIMARSSRRILTVSQYSRAILDLTRVAPGERIGILHNGIDHMLDATPAEGTLTRHGLHANRYVIVFGTHKGYKNVQLIFDAFDRPELSSFRLVVVGESEAKLRANGLIPPANAQFMGGIDDAVLRALYEHATCLVFPSRTEGFGLPPLEAMLLGCPAIVAPAGAMPEICRDAVLYADVDAQDQWAAAVLRLAEDHAFRASKIAAGRRRAEEFTWKRAGSKLLDEALLLARD